MSAVYSYVLSATLSFGYMPFILFNKIFGKNSIRNSCCFANNTLFCFVVSEPFVLYVDTYAFQNTCTNFYEIINESNSCRLFFYSRAHTFRLFVWSFSLCSIPAMSFSSFRLHFFFSLFLSPIYIINLKPPINNTILIKFHSRIR